MFRGAGYDLETANEQGTELIFSWFVDNKPVGTGEWMTMEALTPGEHGVELRVHDGDQMMASDFVWIQAK